jgi:hypothetical protein
MVEVLSPFFPWLRLLHALTGIALVAGLIGRWIALQHAEQAAAASDLGGVQALLGASGVFERMVIISSQVVVVLGLLAAWAVGYPLLGFIQGASQNWLLVSLVLYIAIMALVPTVFLPRGRRFGVALDDSIARGQPTPGLVAAFRDPVSRAAHYVEAGAVLVVLVLMLAKPF